MNCEQVNGLLFEYEEGNLHAEDFGLIREHLRACHSCNRELKSVRSLMSQTNNLRPGVAPARDLWPEILSRLEEVPEAPAELSDSRTRQPRTSPWRRLEIAAVLGFLALFVSMAIRWTGSESSSGLGSGTIAGSRPADSPSHQYQADQLSDSAAQARVEDGVLQTKRDLLIAIERERSVLGPEAFAEVESSIRQVDLAIGETRVALENYPESRQLNHRLAALYLNESELLKRLSRV